MVDTAAPNGDLTPVESAILSIDGDVKIVLRLVREVKNQIEMIETACKLMSLDLKMVKKNFQKEG